VYACPGFAGDALQAVDHIDGRHDPLRVRSAERFNSLAAWKECQECAFIPVCAGGCTVAAHKEIGRITAPNCHKASFEAGVISLARDAARAQERELVG
jgi:radical SAM protein with 4Fe4S-binding SPASM domain